jgi:signal peptidase I
MMWVLEKYVKYIIIFVVLWVGLWFYRTFSCAKVYSNQMAPALSDEQFKRVYVKQRFPHQIKQGDIVYYERSLPPERNKYFFGRVIAKEGLYVDIARGVVRIVAAGDSTPHNIAEPYVHEQNRNPIETFTGIVVPKDHYFILNDNRLQGKDSRHFGPLPVYAVIGKVAQ